jgi:hypothetical protein
MLRVTGGAVERQRARVPGSKPNGVSLPLRPRGARASTFMPRWSIVALRSGGVRTATAERGCHGSGRRFSTVLSCPARAGRRAGDGRAASGHWAHGCHLAKHRPSPPPTDTSGRPQRRFRPARIRAVLPAFRTEPIIRAGRRRRRQPVCSRAVPGEQTQGKAPATHGFSRRSGRAREVTSSLSRQLVAAFGLGELT